MLWVKNLGRTQLGSSSVLHHIDWGHSEVFSYSEQGWAGESKMASPEAWHVGRNGWKGAPSSSLSSLRASLWIFQQHSWTSCVVAQGFTKVRWKLLVFSEIRPQTGLVSLPPHSMDQCSLNRPAQTQRKRKQILLLNGSCVKESAAIFNQEHLVKKMSSFKTEQHFQFMRICLPKLTKALKKDAGQIKERYCLFKQSISKIYAQMGFELSWLKKRENLR